MDKLPRTAALLDTSYRPSTARRHTRTSDRRVALLELTGVAAALRRLAVPALVLAVLVALAAFAWPVLAGYLAVFAVAAAFGLPFAAPLAVQRAVTAVLEASE